MICTRNNSDARNFLRGCLRIPLQGMFHKEGLNNLLQGIFHQDTQQFCCNKHFSRAERHMRKQQETRTYIFSNTSPPNHILTAKDQLKKKKREGGTVTKTSPLLTPTKESRGVAERQVSFGRREGMTRYILRRLSWRFAAYPEGGTWFDGPSGSV